MRRRRRGRVWKGGRRKRENEERHTHYLSGTELRWDTSRLGGQRRGGGYKEEGVLAVMVEVAEGVCVLQDERFEA